MQLRFKSLGAGLALVGGLIVAGFTASGPAIAAQVTPPVTPPQVTPPATPPAPASVESAVAQAGTAEANVTTAPPATLTYANRPIVELRASVLNRSPSERVAAARQALDRLVEARDPRRVETRAIGPVTVIGVGGRDIFGLVPADIDTLAGETMAESVALTASNLQAALDEVAEARRPREVLFRVLQFLLATAIFIAIVWGLARIQGAASRRLSSAAIRRLQSTAVGDEELVRSSRIMEFLERFVAVAIWALILFFGYWWLTFSLRRFPYTRFWGESLRTFLLEQLSLGGTAFLHALPGLFTVLLIVLVTRFVSRLVQVFFQALEDKRIAVPWIYPETAEPTRKLFVLALWLFAIAISYPYLPGSDSEAFKGVSVFVGLMVSLGSSGLVNQVMSGFTLTYSRALRKGDFVAVGDIEGTVTLLGTLSTKIRTPRNEDVTIPNAVIVSQTVTNYTRMADDGVFVPTDVTIGYNVAWRQVQALLLLAAARTPGVRRQPAPLALQTALENAFVKYTLMFCLEDPTTRRITLASVRANILDAFNEYGVQITSPNYEADPPEPKIVPRDQWFAAPAVTEAHNAALGQHGPGSGKG